MNAPVDLHALQARWDRAAAIEARAREEAELEEVARRLAPWAGGPIVAGALAGAAWCLFGAPILSFTVASFGAG